MAPSDLPSLGQYLRQERERRGITIEQVASATKIGIKTLHALEEDRYSELPARPFIRGFVTSYARFIGLDFSLPMLRLAQAKRAKAAHGDSADFVMGSAMFAPFKNTSFDSAMTAFVLRNVSDLPLMFTEALRVLKPGGKFVSIDMFPPAASWFAGLYSVYFYRLMPRIGGFLSHDPKAYRYLSDSVREFHSPEQVSEFLETAGFHQVRLEKFLGGAVCMHIAIKAGAAF